jgi:hypothetical protein
MRRSFGERLGSWNIWNSMTFRLIWIWTLNMRCRREPNAVAQNKCFPLVSAMRAVVLGKKTSISPDGCSEQRRRNWWNRFWCKRVRWLTSFADHRENCRVDS